MKLTNEHMDNLVDEWHDWPQTMGLTKFLCSRTGLTHDQVVHWLETAKLPDESEN